MLFGLMLGVLVGSLTRRSILAMALTFVLYVACILLFSGNYGNLVPPHVHIWNIMVTGIGVSRENW